ncbi:MAG: TonB-dependent receptor [Gammaproteobacteria bacterium]|nr:TonB-dependent receptor [Gammaproteobacteria bacterium]
MKRLLAAAPLLLATVLSWPQEIETVTVVGTTPLGADDLDARDFPGRVQHFDAETLRGSGSLDIAGFLDRRAAGVHVHSAQGNPLQSDLYYRGFAASPLLGLPMGLTVYQNGVRLNEPLSDAVNWDLVPMQAVAGLTLLGGSNPLYGLNSLGGSIALRMKNRFTHPGHAVELEGGSHNRFVANVESGGGSERLAWYGNVQRFREDGWRDLSDSRAENGFATVGWRGAEASLDLDFHASRSELVGNGLAPRGLLARDRASIFTAPDITENDASLWTLRGARELGRANVAGQLSWRSNDTASFNGDGLDEDDVGELVDVGFGGVEPLRDLLHGGCRQAVAEELASDAFDASEEEDFLEAVGESGCAAVNNLSDRKQDALSAVVELDMALGGPGLEHDVRAGIGYYRGRSAFRSTRQFALLDPVLRSTVAPAAVRGRFADERTDLKTRIARRFVYLGDTMEVTDRWTVSLSGFLHASRVSLHDRTGETPQLDGRHDYRSFNWGLGSVYRLTPETRGYVSISQASRLPTPIELACSEALAFHPETGDVEECRLPNAFLADPPLEEVVSRSLDLGLRGERSGVSWGLGAFHARNRDDIIWQTGQTRAHGLFRNVDETLRLGVEASLTGRRGAWRWSVDYTFLRATFEDDFDVLSPNHPANAAAETTRPVRAGDAIPGIPRHLWKAAAEYAIDQRWTVGLDLIAVSSSHLRGDESNELDRLPGYATVNARATYRRAGFEAFALIENLFDREYENFGLVGEEPDEVIGLDEIGDDVRFYAPGAPVSAWVGIRRRF